jgi:thiol-disulfide isomerase/thioredoxin
MKISFTLALILLLNGCNQNSQSADQAKTDHSTVKTTAKITEKTAVNTKSPIKPKKEVQENTASKQTGFDFTYPDLEGNPVKLSNYRGKWVIANFWATWCPPCRKEIPDFVKFKKLHGDKVEILGINNEDAENDAIQDFVFEYEINYPVLRANVYNPSDFSRKNTMGLPTTIIFNPQGVQVAKRIGPMHITDLIDIIKP